MRLIDATACRREIGIRTALGVGARRVVVSILMRAVAQIGVGVALGFVTLLLVVAAPQHGRLSQTQFMDLLATAGVMATVGLVAAIEPARRALRIQPTEALKSE